MTLRAIQVNLGEGGRHVIGAEGRATNEEEALLVVERLVHFNLQGPERVPALYDADVHYRAQATCEGYAPATECARRGYADATEIVAWRCANLRQSGFDPGARPMLVRETRGDGHGFIYYTARVLRSDMTVEDPVEKIRKRTALKEKRETT